MDIETAEKMKSNIDKQVIAGYENKLKFTKQRLKESDARVKTQDQKIDALNQQIQ